MPWTERAAELYRKEHDGRWPPGYKPEKPETIKLSEKERAGLRIQKGKPLPGDSVLLGLKKIAGIRPPSAKEEAIERGVLTDLWPRSVADSTLAGIPREKPPVSPYGKPPWWMNPDALKTDWGKAYARKQIEGTGKSVSDQIEEYIAFIEVSEEPMWGKDGTETNPELRNFARARIDALTKESIPKRSLIDKKWGGLKYQKPDIEKDSVIRLLQPKAKTKPKLDY